MWIVLSRPQKYFSYFSWPLPTFFIWQKLFFYFTHKFLDYSNMSNDVLNLNLVGKGRDGTLKRYTHIHCSTWRAKRFDEVNLENSNFNHILLVCPFIVENFNKNYRIGANILEVCSLGKGLNYRLIKSDKTYRSYYWKSLIIVLYILYVSAYQMNFQ